MEASEEESFKSNWKERKESYYNHWTRGEIKNQIQLAFRNHWILFQELLAKSGYNNGKRVLEVGCGRGTLSCYFSDKGYDCTLIDISDDIIKQAKRVFADNDLKANFVVGDAKNMPFKEDSFDIIFSIGLLEHFEDIDVILKEQIRVLSNKGMFFGYVVPRYTDNLQKDFEWINQLLKGYQNKEEQFSKTEVYRSDSDSKKYVKILSGLGLKEISVSGVYPLPMISHSVEFPFSLMPNRSEKAVVDHFQKILADRKKKMDQNPWLCDEGYGQAFLIWGIKDG